MCSNRTTLAVRSWRRAGSQYRFGFDQVRVIFIAARCLTEQAHLDSRRGSFGHKVLREGCKISL